MTQLASLRVESISTQVRMAILLDLFAGSPTWCTELPGFTLHNKKGASQESHYKTVVLHGLPWGPLAL